MVTWTQIGIHAKRAFSSSLLDTHFLIRSSAVILLNVLNFWNPLRTLIQSGIKEGFIQPHNDKLVVFVDGPSDLSDHDTFDWGNAAINALDTWDAGCVRALPFNWQGKRNACEV